VINKDRLKALAARTPLHSMAINPSRRLTGAFVLPHRLYIATHHKTGTMWLQRIFRSFAYYHGLRTIAARDLRPELPFDILLDGHSGRPLDELGIDYRGVHMIRDPRDLIVSACRYHQKSVEKRVLAPRPEFGGLSYQEKINSYADFGDKLLFEMEHSAYKNITAMRNWNYSDPLFLELRYEELLQDTQLLLFGRMFAHLEIPGAAIPSALAIAWNGSLFSGTVDHRHITSGKSGDWRDKFEPHHVARFRELFGDVCEVLGYETTADWAVV
jgi:hypothetical protein